MFIILLIYVIIFRCYFFLVLVTVYFISQQLFSHIWFCGSTNFYFLIAILGRLISVNLLLSYMKSMGFLLEIW